MPAIGRSFPSAPFKDAASAIEYLNDNHWKLKVARAPEHIDLWAGDGEVHLFRAGSDDELASFLMGMALVFYMVGASQVPGFDQWEAES